MRQIEAVQFHPHTGIAFSQNQCLSCAFLSLCLKNDEQTQLRLARSNGVDLGWTSLVIKNPPMPPQLNEKRAQFVLAKIDQILAWEQEAQNERDTKFVELGRYLCEVRAGQYWRLERLSSFDDFLERRFPASRRKAYYLMAVHEKLPRQMHKDWSAQSYGRRVRLGGTTLGSRAARR